MARAKITITDITKNAETSAAAGTSLATIATDGGYIDSSDTQGLLLRIVQTFAGAKVITAVAGDNPPALCAGQGDLDVSMAQNDVSFVALESARFAQSDGKINIDAEAGTTGTIECYRVGV